jgi:hypothetical protein
LQRLIGHVKTDARRIDPQGSSGINEKEAIISIKTTAVLADATLFASAQTATAAEPLLLGDAQLDQVSAAALPDIIIWDIDGSDGLGPAGSKARRCRPP